MKREELTEILRQEYRAGKSCGVEKVSDEKFKNIWFVVPPSPPKDVPKGLKINSLGRARQILEKIPLFDQTTEIDRVISYLFVRREAVQSSRIEGTWSTIDHVLTPGELFDQKTGKSERASVLGYASALENEFEAAQTKGPEIFSESTVCRLHKKMMAKDPHFKGRSGEIRSPKKVGSVVWIGGIQRIENSIYNPTPPQHVKRCLNETLKWMSNAELIELGNAGMGLSLPLRIAIGHSHFEAVHPFRDGNGRVGRMLIALQMACEKILPLYLSGFIEAEKQEYSRALQQSQKKLNYSPIIDFLSEAIIASDREATETKKAIQSLPEHWKRRGKLRDGSAAKRAIPHLLGHPIFSAKDLMKFLKVSQPAAQNAAAQLVKAKIVRERTGYGRNRVFAAEEVVSLLSRKFGDSKEVALEHAMDLLK